MSEEAELLALAAATPPLEDGHNSQKLMMQKAANEGKAVASKSATPRPKRPKSSRATPKSASTKPKRQKSSRAAPKSAPKQGTRTTPTCYV